MGSVSKKIRNNIQARRMGANAGLVVDLARSEYHLKLERIPPATGLSVSDFRHSMMLLFRKHRARTNGVSARAYRNASRRGATRRTPTKGRNDPAVFVQPEPKFIPQSFLGRVAQWGRKVMNRGR